MSATPAQVYVYYRVTGDTRKAAACAQRVLDDVARTTGVEGRLLERCDDPVTWMEAYPFVADVPRFLDVLDEAVRRHALADHVEDRRHVECFRERTIPVEAA